MKAEETQVNMLKCPYCHLKWNKYHIKSHIRKSHGNKMLVGEKLGQINGVDSDDYRDNEENR